ncbi:MAG: TetM/TetW/TetO/TetS family tetracycline resistance ribosomal protection protein [Bacteroidales bacterium]|nr:TetM/TetW/TetO/TetS family tetracycline resistance ribosomal protection protein [Bacteroidales bacterium]
MAKKIINLGILAHVDAGKTTLTEHLLYLGGAIKKPGNVDKGTVQTDFLPIEKERGISVRSASSTFFWKEVQINLIDTPGHIDFSAEVERSLSILDAAILVISAVEGVQAHTENIWLALKEHKIPTLLFINKIDRIGADKDAVIQEIKQDLSANSILLQELKKDSHVETIQIVDVWNNPLFKNELTEEISNVDDLIMEHYLEGQSISLTELENSFKKAIARFQLFPVLMGAAKNEIGVNELLDAIVRFLPFAKGKEEDPFSAVVFKVEHNKKFGKIAGIRLYGGKLAPRDIVQNATQNTEEKVSLIKRYNAGKIEDEAFVVAGDVATVCGLSEVRVGDVLGTIDFIPNEIKLNSPLLTVQIRPENENDYPNLAEALQQLTDEDPALAFDWLREEKELHLSIMGWIQIEVLERILENRFGIRAKFDNPTVIYKESPKKMGVGFARYWMPKPCWAIVKFKIEPGNPGSGLVYESKVGVNKIQRKYQNEIERTLEKALKQGPKGWEVSDLKITLIDGEDHEVHSRPGDFAIATPMAIMNGLVNTDTKLLEPYLQFQITAPEDLLGAITSDIIQMRGTFESPKIENGKFRLEGTYPVATSMDFPVKLSSRSGGKAKIKSRFHGYQECEDEQGVIRPYKGISPLDEAKYILKARKAIQESWKV